MDQLEVNIKADLGELRMEIAQINLRLDNLTARVDRLEAGFLQLNDRVDSLANDMRQRFHVVNERISELAA